MNTESGTTLARVPRTVEELAELEGSYRPFSAAAAWHGVHIDVPRWDRFARALARRRDAAGDDAWADTLDRLLRAAALDSAALDGLFPANPELTALVLSDVVSAARGDDPAEILVECSRRALVLASEAAASGRVVDPGLIAVLQDVITEAQGTYTVSTDRGEMLEVDLPRRQYKPVSNYLPLPGGELAAFAPARLVAAEMDRLSGEFGSAAFLALHPAVQAAYAHYALTAIHPFADGNGRLARTVASVFLLRATGVPLIVFAEQWPAYYQALRLATQQGDWQALTDFCCAAAMSALDLAANLLVRPTAAAPATAVLAPVPAGRDEAAAADEAGLDEAELDEAALHEAARGLLETVAIELREALCSPPRGTRIAITTSRAMPAGRAEGAYRPAAGQAVVRFAARAVSRPELAGTGTADATVGVEEVAATRAADLEFLALVSIRPGDLLPVAIREARSGELLEVAAGDAYPLVNESAVVRARLWVRRLAAAALAGTAR